MQYGDNGQEITALREAGLRNLHANPNPDLIGTDDLARSLSRRGRDDSGVNPYGRRPGATGRGADAEGPTLVLVSQGGDSPWYPCLRLLREDPAGGFAAALQAAPAALRAALAGG